MDAEGRQSARPQGDGRQQDPEIPRSYPRFREGQTDERFDRLSGGSSVGGLRAGGLAKPKHHHQGKPRQSMMAARPR